MANLIYSKIIKKTGGISIMKDCMLFDPNGQGTVEFIIMSILALVAGDILRRGFIELWQKKSDQLESIWRGL